MMRTLFLVLALSFAASLASADVIDSTAPVPPGYQVQVTGMDGFADRVFVNVRSRPPAGHGDQPTNIASYTIANEFPIDLPERLCAVPSSWIVDSPVGGLGSRMLTGARSASGAIETDPRYVTELLARFDAPEVACAQPFDVPGVITGVERVVDTVRVAGVDGRTLRLELVEVAYQRREGGLVTVPAPAGATTRPPPPSPAPSGCACVVGARSGGSRASLFGALVLGALVVRRRRAL